MNFSGLARGAPRWHGAAAALGLLVLAAPSSAQTQLPAPAFGQADARQDRLEALESQLSEATAENERLQFELAQARREVSRLNGVVGELSSVNQTLTAERTAAAAAPRPRTRQAAPAAPAPAAAAPPAAPAANPAEAGAAYSQARELLVAGKNAEAEAAFAQFLQSYPAAETAQDARYWLAFTLLARNNYQDAAANFVQYLQANPRGPRAPEAQVRLGMALAGLGQTRQACGAWASLQTRYPNASRSVRDLAARESGAAQCQA